MKLQLQLLFAILPLIISPAFAKTSKPSLLLPVLVLPLIISPTLAKTCCSSPQPSQPILCSSPNSCILRGLGNTSGWLEDHCHNKAWPRQDKDQDKTKTKTSFSCDVLTRDPRRRGGVSTHPGQQSWSGRKKYNRGLTILEKYISKQTYVPPRQVLDCLQGHWNIRKRFEPEAGQGLPFLLEM